MTRYVLITGASTGIGAAIALDLDKRGFQVLAGVRKDSDGAALQQQASGNLQPVILDVTTGDSIAAAVQTTQALCGNDGLYALVNNAGVVVSSPMEFVPLDDLRWQFEVNVTGQVAVTQAFMPMLRQSKGRILFTSSSSAYFTPPFVGPYCASKHAIEAVIDAFRRELLPWGVDVISIQPGAIKTPIWDKSKSKADALIAGLPARAIELYGNAIEAVTTKVEEQAASGGNPQVVADAVYHALTSRKAHTRYKVGPGAKLQAILDRVVPDRVLDKLVRKEMGL